MPNENKLQNLKQILERAQIDLQSAREILDELTGEGSTFTLESKVKKVGSAESNPEGKIIEGVFDGQNMIGPDGKQYSIPANYASKSKLVEGDTLKLTIMPDGSFIYKQIGPVERNRLVGVLAKDEATDEFRVLAGDKAYKVLLASITYFKGEVGDEVVILVPKDRESKWAAIENIIKKTDFDEDLIKSSEKTQKKTPESKKKTAKANKETELEEIGEVK